MSGSDNNEKLDQALQKLQLIRARIRGRFAQRDTPLLDKFLQSTLNGHAPLAPAKDESSPQEVTAVRARLQQLEGELEAEREKRLALQKELEARGFSVRVG